MDPALILSDIGRTLNKHNADGCDFTNVKFRPKAENLEADPSHKKIFSDFAHNCPQVQPGFLVKACISKTEKKYFGCRAHPEGSFLAPLIFF